VAGGEAREEAGFSGAAADAVGAGDAAAVTVVEAAAVAVAVAVVEAAGLSRSPAPLMSGSQNQGHDKQVLRGHQPVTRQIIQLLEENGIPFGTLEHEPVFTSQEAAEVRNTLPEQGAKALIVKAADTFTMLVLRGDQRTKNSKVRRLLGSKHLRFANKEELLDLTGCHPGSVPPFGQLFGLRVLLDEGLTAFDEVAFNAGSHTVSLKMSCQDLVTITAAEVVSMC